MTIAEGEQQESSKKILLPRLRRVGLTIIVSMSFIRLFASSSGSIDSHVSNFIVVAGVGGRFGCGDEEREDGLPLRWRDLLWLRSLRDPLLLDLERLWSLWLRLPLCTSSALLILLDLLLLRWRYFEVRKLLWLRDGLWEWWLLWVWLRMYWSWNLLRCEPWKPFLTHM